MPLIIIFVMIILLSFVALVFQFVYLAEINPETNKLAKITHKIINSCKPIRILLTGVNPLVYAIYIQFCILAIIIVIALF